MGQAQISVNGRRYEVSCGDGEEARLQELAAALDRRVRRLAGSIGQVGEVRLLLLTCLLMEDELGEVAATATGDAAAAGGASVAGGPGRQPEGAAAPADGLGGEIEALAERLEAVAERLKQS